MPRALCWFRLGAGLMAAAVAAGAFGAHALKTRLSADMLGLFEVGVRYHAYHALALLAVGWLASVRPGRAVSAAGWLFAAGILVFSGSLYAYALTEAKPLVMATPLGGLCFLAGWAFLIGGARSS